MIVARISGRRFVFSASPRLLECLLLRHQGLKILKFQPGTECVVRDCAGQNPSNDARLLTIDQSGNKKY